MMANEITYKPVQISIFQKIAICYSFIVYGLNNVFGSNYEICKYFIYGLLVVLAAIVFLIQIKNISFKRIWVLLLFGIIGACIFPFIYTPALAVVCLALVCCINAPYRRIFKYGFYSQLAFFLFAIFIWLFGYNKIYDIGSGEFIFREVRYSLGFGNTNTAAGYFLFTIFLFYAYKPRAKIKESLLLILAFIIVYILTASRTSLMAFIIFYLLYPVARMIKYSPKFSYFCSSFFVIFTIASILLSIYGHDNVLNEFSTNRLAYCYEAMTNYPLGIFPKEEITLIVDIFYIQLLWKNGLFYYFLIAIIITGYFILIGKYLSRKNLGVFILLGVVILVYGLGEAYLVNFISLIHVFFFKLITEKVDNSCIYKEDVQYFDVKVG